MFASILKYLIKQLKRVENAAVSFALQKYMTEQEVISLSWLPVIERSGFQLEKMAHMSANSETWPKFL